MNTTRQSRACAPMRRARLPAGVHGRSTVLALCLAAVLQLAAPAAAQEVGVAASVNGAEISVFRLERHFEDYLKQRARNVGAIRNPEVYTRLKREALDQLIDKELLWQEARRRGIEIPDEAVQKARSEIAAGFGSAEGFEHRLREAGFDDTAYDDTAYDTYLRHELAARRVLEVLVAGVTVTDEEIERTLRDEPPPDGMPAAEARARVRDYLLELRRAAARRGAIERLRGEAHIERFQRL